MIQDAISLSVRIPYEEATVNWRLGVVLKAQTVSS